MTSKVLALVHFSVALDSRGTGAADPHTVFLNDPEVMHNRFMIQYRQRARHEPWHMLLVRLRWSEHYDPRIFRRRISAQISKIQFERQERPSSRLARVYHALVWGAGESFVIDRLAVMASLLQETRSIDREILVDLATHWYGAVSSHQAGRATTRSCANSAA